VTPAYSDWSDSDLVNACLKGDERAWSALIGRYKRLIFSFPIRYGATPQDASDVFQAVCVKLCRELPRLRKVDSVRSWLMTISSHEAFHWRRRQNWRTHREGTELAETQPDTTALPAELLELAEREQRIRDAIARLSPRCQQLLQCLFFEQPTVPYAEIARRLGVATGSIGFFRGRCLKQLRVLLEDLDL
jgi:RNA polymerase sigma factor (sigma-70 family)